MEKIIKHIIITLALAGSVAAVSACRSDKVSAENKKGAEAQVLPSTKQDQVASGDAQKGTIKRPDKLIHHKQKLAAQPTLDVVAPAALADSAQAYLDLKTLRIHPGLPPAEIGLHFVGAIVAGKFVPHGTVQGKPAADTAKGPRVPGWVELSDGSFHNAATGRPPFPPFVEGMMYKDGGFVPNSGDLAGSSPRIPLSSAPRTKK